MPAEADFSQHAWIPASIVERLPARGGDSHKGNFGSVGIIGGAPGMIGAALLAARAALHLGAGKVYAACIDVSVRVDFMQPEIMHRRPQQLMADGCDVLAVGPGLGRSAQAGALLEQALGQPATLVLDADALNLLAITEGLKDSVRHRDAPTFLTPHPGEAARLLGCEVAAIQQDRLNAALRLADDYRAYVVLKGANSLCVAPDGQWRVNTTGNPGLSSAGMGDVLTGMLAALLAQHVPSFDALQLAVYLHGKAADTLVERGVGPVGLTGSELILEARRLLNQTS